MRNHPNNNYRQQGNRNADQRQQAPTFNESIQNEWIREGANDEMNNYASRAGKAMADGYLTNAKIRSIYGEIKRIQMSGFESNKPSFFMLKPKVAYAYGRERKNLGLRFFKFVFDQAFAQVNDEKSFHNFCNFMEAIIAYHRAFGGKEN